MTSPRPMPAPEIAERRKHLEITLEAARSTFAADIRVGRGGRAAHERSPIDSTSCCARSSTPRGRCSKSAVAVAALGGYGRRALCLHSDIDLLVVFEGRLGRAEERFVKALLHPLWDLKLQVGHQVRLLDDFAVLERDNPLYLLALMDARFLAGDDRLFAPGAGAASSARCDDARGEMLDALLGADRERHAQFNDTLYQLEPDLKDAPGGLRDVGGGEAPALARPRRRSSRARSTANASIRRKTSCCASVRCSTSRPGATRTC